MLSALLLLGALETGIRFFEVAQGGGSCAEVWKFYSAGTQENIRAEARRRQREWGDAPKVEEMYCALGDRLQRETARVVREDADTAVVAATFKGKRPRHQYDIFAPTIVRTEEVLLIREGGGWRVERPRKKLEPTHVKLIEVGPVDVHLGRLIRGLHYTTEAMFVVRTPRASLESVLRDPDTWARVLPSFKSIEPLERTGELERVRLSFAEPERSMTVSIRRSDESVLWDPEGANKAPVYLRGSWRLERVSGTATRVKLRLVLDPRHFPEDFTENMFSPERLGQAVEAFVTAAGR